MSDQPTTPPDPSSSPHLPPPPSAPSGDVPQYGASPMPPPPPANLTPPPGYTAYDAAPTPHAPLSRVKGLATATTILTGVAGVGALVTAITTPGASDSARDFLEGRISEDQFLDDYNTFGLTQSLQSIGTLVAGILTIIWLYRIAGNVRKMGRSTTWAPLWAVFGWVLPPSLIVIPFLMVREVWKASDPQAPHTPTGWKQSADNPLIWAWFGVYGVLTTVILITTASSAFSAGLDQDADRLAELLDDFSTLQTLGAVVTAAGAVLWILVVRQLTARHVSLTQEP